MAASASTACPAPDAPDLGLAVCLLGFVRTLGERRVYESLANFRLQARHVDFFGVVSSGGEDTAKGQWADVDPSTLAPALARLRPVAWEDYRDTSGPRCGLLCMRQYDRMARCGEMIAAREARCGGRRYAWVVKGRPDVTLTDAHTNRTLDDFGMRADDRIVYKDRRAGDMVDYIPRVHWDNVTRALAAPCDEVRRLGVDCTVASAGTGGGGCKCNAWFSVAVARKLGLQLRYHRWHVEPARTREAAAIIGESRRKYGGDGMRPLHNKTTLSADLRHVRDAARAPAPRAVDDLRPHARKLRLAWLGTAAQNCSEWAANYYCLQYGAISEAATVTPTAPESDAAGSFRRRADAIVLGSKCFSSKKAGGVSHCLRQLRPDDPPVVLMLNKLFENLDAKLQQVRAHREQIALVVAPGPHVADYEEAAGVPVRFWPYGACTDYALYAFNDSVGYRHDVGFTGSMDRYNKRYHLRSIALNNKTVRANLGRRGVRIFTPGWLWPTHYIKAMAQTKVWFATTEEGDHASTRFFEVLISGRAMLLCNRNPTAYAPLGLVEGTHAAMYNTSEEFEEKLVYYTRAEHDHERRAIVAAAYKLATEQHSWARRAEEFVALVREHAPRHRMRGAAAGAR